MYTELLKKVPLFYGLNETEINMALKCLFPKIKNYNKGDVILMRGDKATDVGIVLIGKVQIIKEDFLGNRNIIAEAEAAELFAEVFSCSNTAKLPVTVVASAESRILFIDYKKIVSSCSAACSFHTRLIENMLSILANKNILLNQKIEHISKRTTREKLLSFLSTQFQKSGSYEFCIPFNRQELADYLCVDRSAMSNELCKLRTEGIIDFRKNKFKILADYNMSEFN